MSRIRVRARFLELDALRGLAALAVVLFHYTTRYDQLFSHTSPVSFSLPTGYYGVQLFFMISGFVIFLTLERTTCPMDFVVSRFSRLYPAYWAAVILTFCLLQGVSLPDRDVNLLSALVNITMLQEWFYVPHVDGVYWTLTVEVTFYVLMLALSVTGLISCFVLVCSLWLVAVVAANVPFLSEYVPGLVRNLFILDHAPFFIAGMCFYLRKTRGPDMKRVLLVFGCLGAAALTVEVTHLWIIGVFFLVFYAFSRGWLAFLVVRPMVFLGTISYTLYLIHQNLGYAVIRGLEARNVGADLSVALAIVTSMVVASLVTFWVEKPGMRAIRAWYRARTVVEESSIVS